MAAVGLLVLLASGLWPGGMAAQEGRVITYGESLSPDQKRELEDFFDVGGDDRTFTITTADSVKAMEGIFDTSTITSAYSSTALTCRDLGDGLEVRTRNITLVPPGLYAMALVTAGIGDAELVVAAPNSIPAQGTAALTGVFKEWEEPPCGSGDTNRTRQRLALEELTLTVRIGQALGIPDGVRVATQLVLETQKTIVTERLARDEEIDQAIAEQERAKGVSIPGDMRAQLIDLMTRLAEEEIDWGTFSAGWEIEWSENNTRVIMTGDGIAVRNARATATAEANMTATAEANLTATADARASATAAAQATATARAEAAMTATAEAEWAMTATAQAQADVTATPTHTPEPTATPTPMPTATPLSSTTVSGTVADAGQGHVSIVQDGGAGQPVPYAVHSVATIVRGAERATLDSLVPGERAVLTLDGPTRQVVAIVVQVEAQPAPAPEAETSDLTDQWWVVLASLTGLLLVKRRGDPEPFVVKRKRS